MVALVLLLRMRLRKLDAPLLKVIEETVIGAVTFTLRSAVTSLMTTLARLLSGTTAGSHWLAVVQVPVPDTVRTVGPATLSALPVAVAIEPDAAEKVYSPDAGRTMPEKDATPTTALAV